MLLAITRDISPNFNQCELTHLDRTPIDVALAQAQHHQYQAALRQLGCEVIALPDRTHQRARHEVHFG
jgi:dimethylargininase